MEIKICGMTNYDDIMVALEAGADYVGFVLYPPSPRSIRPLAMARILDRVDLPCRAVAVCVNMTRVEVDSVVADCRLHAVQLHGDEKPADFAGLTPELWRAVKLVEGQSVPPVAEWAVARFVVDAVVPGQYGGTGQTADWEEARDFAACHSAMLAGGLTPDNVAAAIEAVKPLGVDVASGVEKAPGRKDHALVRRFIRNA